MFIYLDLIRSDSDSFRISSLIRRSTSYVIKLVLKPCTNIGLSMQSRTSMIKFVDILI